MNKQNLKTGAALAAAAAALFVTLPSATLAGGHAAAETADKGHCVGANACKGQSSCATANSSCSGQNACKGQGFTVTTKAECAEAGGEWEAS